MKSWFLDTNTLAYAINGQGGVRERLNVATLDGVLLTGTIAIYELLYGAELSRRRDENRRNIFNLIKRIKVEPFDFKTAEKMASLQAHFDKKGKTRPRLDLMHAAQALALGAVLVTRDADLTVERIPGLKVQDWYTPGK